MSKSAKSVSLKLPPILQTQQLSKSSNSLDPSNSFSNLNKSVFKLNEQVFILNKCKIENLDNNYHLFQTITSLLKNLESFEQHNKLDLINWNIFRGLIGLFIDIIKLHSDSYKTFNAGPPSTGEKNPITYNKKVFHTLNQDGKRILICTNVIKILYFLILNSKELKIKLEDLNGLDELIRLANNDSYLNSNEKHKSVESTLLTIYNLSLEYKRKCPVEYGQILLKFNKVDDLTAYIRCKSVLNFFPSNENFEERIGTKVVLFLKLLKKSYSSPIKAEINSIFFIYSALKEVKYKSKIVKLILDENCFQIFLIKLSELAFVCGKFCYPITKRLDQKLLPNFDSNQNINNTYRTVYYSYVFYQMLYLSIDCYKSIPIKAKYYATKSLCTFLTNKDFLKNFSMKSPSTIIDLEKCLLCIHMLNENHAIYEFDIFEILFNIGINYDDCSKESFLILSKIKSEMKLSKLLDKLVVTFNNIDPNEIISSNNVYNCLFLIHLLLEEKLEKTFEFDIPDDYDRIILTNKYQHILNEVIKYALKNLNFKIDLISFEKYLTQNFKEQRKESVFFYILYLIWFLLSKSIRVNRVRRVVGFDLNITLDSLQAIQANMKYANKPNHSIFLYKSTQSMNMIFKLDHMRKLISIDRNKFDALNNILYEITVRNDFNQSCTATVPGTARSSSFSSRPVTNKEQINRRLVLDDLISILIKMISYDPISYLNFYLKFIEIHLAESKLRAFRSENLIKFYHFKERDYFYAFTKHEQTSTYNLLVLSEYFRNNKFPSPDSSIKSLRLQLITNLKQLFSSDDTYLIEKKYIIDLMISLSINEHIESSLIKNDSDFTESFEMFLLPTFTPKSAASSMPSVNLKEEIHLRNSEPLKIALKKSLTHLCEELNWLISDEFQLNENISQVKNNPETSNKNVLIMYSLECISDCFRIKDELEKNDYRVMLDSYDDVNDLGDLNSNEKNNQNKIKSVIQNNATIIVCLTDKYHKSKYGTVKLKYAHLKKKLIIPVIMNNYFEINDWLFHLNKSENKSTIIEMSKQEFSVFILKLLGIIKISQLVKNQGFSTSTLIAGKQQLTVKNFSVSSLDYSNINKSAIFSLKNGDSEVDFDQMT